MLETPLMTGLRQAEADGAKTHAPPLQLSSDLRKGRVGRNHTHTDTDTYGEVHATYTKVLASCCCGSMVFVKNVNSVAEQEIIVKREGVEKPASHVSSDGVEDGSHGQIK